LLEVVAKVSAVLLGGSSQSLASGTALGKLPKLTTLQFLGRGNLAKKLKDQGRPNSGARKAQNFKMLQVACAAHNQYLSYFDVSAGLKRLARGTHAPLAQGFGRQCSGLKQSNRP
jgi:hypothetical protein